MNAELWAYLRKNKKNVRGWLQRVDAEIIGCLLEIQRNKSIIGSCVEIGVHRGKSFIPLCMSLQRDERALCIDIFDDQSKNLDASGNGDFDKFAKNLMRFRIDFSQVSVIKGSSEEVSAEDVLNQVGPVRFFSIDGGHWKSIVQNDLYLAEKTLARGGVVALDDYCRAAWPDVSTGYAVWQENTETDIVPFAIGSNKLFLCRKDFSLFYREALNTRFLRNYFSKTYQSEGQDIDIYRVEFVKQDEDRIRKLFAPWLKMFFPNVYTVVRSIFIK